MDKKTFFIIEEADKETGKFYAYVRPIPNCYNLKDIFTPSRGCEIVSINACSTKKKAVQIADFWNECAKNNGKYLFNSAPFSEA